MELVDYLEGLERKESVEQNTSVWNLSGGSNVGGNRSLLLLVIIQVKREFMLCVDVS